MLPPVPQYKITATSCRNQQCYRHRTVSSSSMLGSCRYWWIVLGAWGLDNDVGVANACLVIHQASPVLHLMRYPIKSSIWPITNHSCGLYSYTVHTSHQPSSFISCSTSSLQVLPGSKLVLPLKKDLNSRLQYSTTIRLNYLNSSLVSVSEDEL